MASKGSGIMVDSRHVAANVFASIVDARVGKGQEGRFDEFASTDSHRPRIFGGDTELQVVEVVEILQECTCFCNDLTDGAATEPARELRSRPIRVK